MAPSDRQPHSKAESPASGSPQRTPHSILDEGPVDITKRMSTTEKTKRLLRVLSARISENSLLNPITGGDSSRFVLGVVKSMRGAERRWFWDMPIVLIECDPQYIDPPRKEGKKQPPIMASYFVFGDRLPRTLAEDPKLAPFIHDAYLSLGPLGEGGKPFCLFPVEGKVKTVLQRISTAPPPPIEGVEEQSAHLVDISSLGRYLPDTVEGARRILLAHEAVTGAPLDIDNIHDNLADVSIIHFSGEEKKTTIPFAILKLSGGASFRLYPYGKYPPRGEVTQGCEVILSEEKYYLVMPDSVAKELESRFMSDHLSLGQ
ncbi:hypothetical protein GF412_01715 [Candidatus Micrarchaeota archaeon]|nr:hypothetical protein [Candidatus Micrarchaeota archaeon]MBD3417680.1 hypothetical protein [Candidatus Micrarchaeota archaeon]